MKIYETREDMIRDLIPKNTVGCELGVFAGDFATFLFYSLCPQTLYLIDGWDLCGDTLCSGDQNGNGSRSLSAKMLYELVVDRFSQYNTVHVWKGWTHEKILDIPDATLDWIYIDADHSYEGCLRDLELSISKIKPNGFIMGHDYEINKAKCKPDWEFGVGKAVDQFLKNHPSYTMIAKGMDGCVSFILQLKPL